MYFLNFYSKCFIASVKLLSKLLYQLTLTSVLLKMAIRSHPCQFRILSNMSGFSDMGNAKAG